VPWRAWRLIGSEKQAAVRLLLVALLSSLALGCGGRGVVRHAEAPHGEIVHASMSSAALGGDKDIVVWVPAGYETSGERFPVIFLLHGLGGDETDWEGLGLSRQADALGLRAIVVMPDGDDSFYANWAEPIAWEQCLQSAPSWRQQRQGRPPPEGGPHRCVHASRYEDYVVRDLVHWVDAHYRTRADRAARGIGGLSMGGFGALSLAMRHPDVFSVAVSHAGAVSLLYAGPHPFAPGPIDLLDDPAEWGRAYDAFLPGLGDHLRRIFGPDLAGWRAHDPASLAASLHDGELALSFDCGTEDGFEFDDEARHLDAVLTDAGVRHEMQIVPGGEHDDRYFASRLPGALRFFAAHLGGQGQRRPQAIRPSGQVAVAPAAH